MYTPSAPDPELLLRYLRCFNAKERFFLVGYALGNPQFRLGSGFRAALGEVLGMAVPEDAFCAMDYHLDWLYAALHASAHGEAQARENDQEHVKGHQEDVDLLIAFAQAGRTELILIEAKAATAWTNKQAQRKIERLGGIFGADGEYWPHARPRLVLMSPQSSRGLRCADWPAWALDAHSRPLFLPLAIPAGIRRVTRWNEAAQCPDAEGTHWKIVDR